MDDERPLREKPGLSLNISPNHSPIPSLRIITSPTTIAPPVSPFTEKLFTVNKTQSELQKLLAHLLSRLKSREQPPSIYEGLRKTSARKSSLTFGAVVETVRSAVRFKAAADDSVANKEDEIDVGNEQDFSTDDTFDMLTQLRDLLILAQKQGQHILRTQDGQPATRERRLLQPSRSRPDSPTKPKSPELLLECIDILSSIVLEDGRYKVSSARLYRPTLALQAVCLDIAQILIDVNRDDAKVLSLIGFAMIPAFNTFSPSLHARLLLFFERNLVRRVLEDLEGLRGLDNPLLKGNGSSYGTGFKNPVVAIQVDEATDEPEESSAIPAWKQWSSAFCIATPSAVAPSQPLTVYYSSSLIPPLLAAVLDAIEPFDTSNDPVKLYHFCSLINTIVALKQDAYLDLLEVVAYHSATTRRKALSILATFWPKALGHIVIGKALPVIGYSDILSSYSVPPRLPVAPPIRDHPYTHEFMPWLFPPRTNVSPNTFERNKDTCHVCAKAIEGFGLLCPSCSVSVHMNCYDPAEGTYHGQYESTSGSDPRPCFFSFSQLLSPRKDITPHFVDKGPHKFREINLFTLTLCAICCMPLWGCTKQGMKCMSCHRFAHTSCVAGDALVSALSKCEETVFGPSNVAIDFTLLKESFMNHYRQILLTEEEMTRKSYDEISIYYSILWTQLRILEYGLSYRSAIVNQGRLGGILNIQRNSMVEFELHRFVRLYESYLSSSRLMMSEALMEYLDYNNAEHLNGFALLYNWPLLTSIISIIKSPLASHATSTNSNLLQVSDIENDISECDSHPYELLSLSHARAALGYEFNIQSEQAAQYLLSHIHQIGFLTRVDGVLKLFNHDPLDRIICAFPLPSGLDLTTSVETLVVAIQACLSDIDISINEHGFLLLARRFEPTGVASEYALTRLIKIILSWICSEDDRLIIVARDYIGQRLNLPGVRTVEDLQAWPPTAIRPIKAKTAMNSGGDYILCRRQLLSRYAIPWLASLHKLDPALYADCLYKFCTETAESSHPSHDVWKGLSEVDSRATDLQGVGESILRVIMKILQSNVIFSAFGEILTRWFDSQATRDDQLLPSVFITLPRLFSGEAMDISRRTNSANDVTQPAIISTQADSWAIFKNLILSSDVGALEHGVTWLHTMARSAVDIPINILGEIFQRAIEVHVPIRTMVVLLESTMLAIWLKTFSAYDLYKEITRLHSLYAEELSFRMQSEEDPDENLNFLRYSLVTCLLAFGCERSTIISKGLLNQNDIQQLPPRRKTHARDSSTPNTLSIDSELVIILSRYATEGSDMICAIIAKFFAILVSESALLDQHEIDQFILANADALAECAWRFYDLKVKDMGDTRMTLLLRLLVVDSQPLNRLLTSQLRSQQNWQLRFQAVARLFRIILDIINPSFSVQDRQWRTSIVDIINHFFYSLWLDDCEEVRLGVDTWTRTLLPPHLHAISECWDEYMNQSPIADRAELASFLVHLHAHFPRWKVLPWKTILTPLLDNGTLLEIILPEEDHVDVTAGKYTTEGQTRVDPNLGSLRASLMVLSLQMVADSVAIDLADLSKVKLAVAKALGFHAAEQRGQTYQIYFGEHSGLNEISFVVINPLVRVLDAPITLSGFPVGQAWQEHSGSGLIGDLFVDIVLMTWKELQSVEGCPYIAVRGLLEAMLLIIIKHDMNGPTLHSLMDLACDAVKNISNIMQMNTNYEIRRLTLAVMISFLQTFPALALKILSYQINIVTNLAASLSFNAEDPLFIRMKEYLESAFAQYEVTGLFWILSKQGRLPEDFFSMLRHVVYHGSMEARGEGEHLRDSIIRDTLSKVAANVNDAATPDALHNLERYVSLCHHQSYPASLIQHIGLRLTAIARHTADLHTSSSYYKGFDPNPLLLMAAAIVQHNKAGCSELIIHIETLLRAALARFNVEKTTLQRLFEVTATVHRVSGTVVLNGAEIRGNHFALTVLDVLSDGLKGKVRMVPTTLAAMLEVVTMACSKSTSFLPQEAMFRLTDDAVVYMSYPTHRDVHNQSEFTVSIAAARLLVETCRIKFSILRTAICDPRSPATVRVWNLLVLATLEYSDTSASASLFTLFPTFVLAYISSLRLSSLASIDSAPLTVNHAFASVKLWILLARKAFVEGSADGSCDTAERTVWNELWPPFERLLNRALGESSSGEKPPVFTFICGCASDLILFVRQAGSIIAMDTSSHIAILNSLRASSFGDSAATKLARAERSIRDLPVEMTLDFLVSQARQDVLAAEKLQGADLYRQSGNERRREYTDRSRTKDFRSP